ncbi:MAG: NAD(P)/FAD-dependent oxidoreductase [Actinomycetaceae bacterium]|nr:NAD(P)/FAD-dependent oxidoreductase [Actinomycetaceae bacterium]
MDTVSDSSPTPALILGAGPVGLAAALLLANQGRQVTVFEARPNLVLNDDNSYPIGVNLRGQETLRQIDPALVDRLRSDGEIVEGFRIHSASRVLAQLPSGTLIATTRAHLTQILLDQAQQHPLISLTYGHKLTGLDLDSRTLTFDTETGQTTCDVKDSLVLCADGVWSAARRALADQIPSFSPRVDEWGVQFRVLFSQPGASAPELDPAYHHIFTSQGIYTATLPNQRWCVAVTALKGRESEEMLLSTEASHSNVAALRAHLHTHAPKVLPLLTDDDLRAYFSREPFGGAIIRCPRVDFHEWLVLLGDAAHGVIPPTGEGVNSGLEDALLLAQTLAGPSSTPLADYGRARMPDLRALGEYATAARNNVVNEDPAQTVTNVVLRIIGAVGARFGRRDSQVEERLFGPNAARQPYREAIIPWILFRERWSRVVLPIARGALGVVSLVARPRPRQ